MGAMSDEMQGYIDEVDRFVMEEEELVTYRSLSRNLGLSSDSAKRFLPTPTSSSAGAPAWPGHALRNPGTHVGLRPVRPGGRATW